ncbi:MAG TPA: MFS transporter [Burkholderiales bacterium]|jgi:MFS family permease|nr:MFS transporter [Burkholderiales bacterium]
MATQTASSAEDRANPLLALKVRGFRLYWLALVTQVVGQHMFAFTLGWLAFEITGSQAQLGFIHLCGFVPQFALTLLGGVLADRIDARKLIGAAQVNSAIAMIMVGATAMLGVAQIWHLALGAFLWGLSAAIDEPARASFFPRLLPRPLLRSAVPLISMAFGSSRVIAPSIAGFLIAAAGAPTTFLLSAAAVSTMIAVLFLLHPARAEARSHGSLLNNFTESLRYIRGNKVFARVITVSLINATVAMGYIHMLPVFAKDVLEVDSRGLGFLASAAGVGALTGLLSYAWMQSRISPRNLMVGSLTVYSVALIGLAFSDWYWLSCCMIFFAGLCHGYFLTCAQVILQTLVEDHYRGRVMSVFALVWSLVFFGGFLLNLAGSFVGPRLALAGGATIVLAYVWLSLVRATALRNLVLAPKPG